MIARFPGTCTLCQGSFGEGAEIVRASNGAGYEHVTCPPKRVAPKPPTGERSFAPKLEWVEDDEGNVVEIRR